MSIDILDGGEETPKPARKKRRGWLIALIVLGVLLGIIAAIGLYYLNAVNSALNKIERVEEYVPPTYEGRPDETLTNAEGQRPMNILLLGSDSRGDGDLGRSDVIMWVQISGDRKDVYITSFTRDMWVPIPGYGDGKINWAMAFGGVPLQVRTVETLLGARADHVGSIDFEGFIKLTNVLDGVTVYNKYQSSSQGFNFPKGEITIRGEQALAYVRERYSLPAGAWSRAERQRDVVGAIILKMLRPQVLANPMAFGSIVDEAAKTVKVDSKVTNQLIYDTALSMKLSGRESLHSIQAPISGGGMLGDQYVDHPQFEQLKELGTALRTDTMKEYLAKYPK